MLDQQEQSDSSGEMQRAEGAHTGKKEKGENDEKRKKYIKKI